MPAQGVPDAATQRQIVELVQSRRCEEALPLLELARKKDPGDARLPLLAGECQIRLKQYGNARASLEAAQRIAPDLANLDLFLGIAHYHLDDLDAAQGALEKARVTSPGRAEVDLYDGMILLRRGEYREAALALSRARSIDAPVVEPMASYYEGVAWKAAEDLDKARVALKRVEELAPGTAWDEAARRALEAAPGWGFRKSFVEASVGVEYNTNVTVQGNVIAPGDISGRRDVATVWSVLGGTEFYRGEQWSAGALVSYYGNAHTELYRYDLEYPGGSLWLDRKLSDKTTLRLQTDINYAWYGYEPFVVVGGISPQIFHSWDEYGVTWGYTKWYGSDYFFDTFDLPDGIGPPGVNEASARNRDGWGVMVGFQHTLPVPQADLALRGGFNYYHYESQGSDWRYNGYEAVLGFTKPLPWQIVLDGQASYLYQPFENPSTYPESATLPLQFERANRRDSVWQFQVNLERPITPWLKASFRYYYLANASNTAFFDYRQQIWGGYLTFYWNQD